MDLELELLWIVIGGTLIGLSAAAMGLFKKEAHMPMAILFLGLAFIVMYFDPIGNFLLLMFLALVNALWVGLIAHKVIPRFSFLIGILGGVITLLYAFLMSFE